MNENVNEQEAEMNEPMGSDDKQGGMGKLWTGLLVIVVVIVAIVLLTGNGSEQQPDENGDDTTTEEMQEFANDGDLRAVFSQEGDVQCSFSYEDDTAASSGTVFVANGGENVRGEFLTSPAEADQQIQSFYVKQGDTAYSWTNQVTQGIMFTLEEDQFLPEENAEAEGLNMSSEVNYECDSWNVDQSVFEVPEDVEFMDMQELIEAQAGAGTEVQPQ